MKSILVICWLCFLVQSCDNYKSDLIFSPEELSAIPLNPGFSNVTIRSIDGYYRTFSLWVPANIDSHPVPLIIALHGSRLTPGNVSEVYLRYFVQQAFYNLNAIIIAPDLHGKDWVVEESENYILSLIRIIPEVWPVDRHRIIITGYSLGGRGAWYYPDKYPELFLAAIPVASRPVGFLSGIVPHYIVHGRRDEVCDVESIIQAYKIMKVKKRNVILQLGDFTHAQTSGYIILLQESIEWINSLH